MRIDIEELLRSYTKYIDGPTSTEAFNYLSGDLDMLTADPEEYDIGSNCRFESIYLVDQVESQVKLSFHVYGLFHGREVRLDDRPFAIKLVFRFGSDECMVCVPHNDAPKALWNRSITLVEKFASLDQWKFVNGMVALSHFHIEQEGLHRPLIRYEE